jgi:hypothetical protein
MENEESLKLTVTLAYPDGQEKSVEMTSKERHEIVECEAGKTVWIRLVNDEDYFGIFRGRVGNSEIMVQSLDSSSTIGLKVDWIQHFFQEL